MTEKLRTQKDTLAKLMASEDITVVHKKIPTAYFDVKNRILACPIFKDDISPELYDLFMGHEVGHALNTPYEGLHSTLKENRTLKGYLNVIEDVRIESDIKNRFQGLRKSFYSAYNELMEMDFFKLKGRDLQGLALIDKINLITKVGSRVNIKLTDEEQVFLDKAYGCKTWEDVVEVANELYEWSKENETRDENDESIVPSYMYGDDENEFDEDDLSDEFDMGEGDDVEDEDGESGDSAGTSETEGDNLPDIDDGEVDSGEEDASEESDNASGEGEEESERKDTGSKSEDRTGGQGSYDAPDGARESLTEHAAHNNEEQFLSEDNTIITQTDLKEKFDKLDEKAMIVSSKKVTSDILFYLNNKTEEKIVTLAEASGKKLVSKSKNIVSHMAKEFEMRQTAQRSVHAFTGKTGKLDMNRISKYQIVDDVFKRATYLPEGKNHGVTILLDWSGSIASELGDLIEQSIILIEFCRKVQIPYRLYAFSDSWYDPTRKDNEDSEDIYAWQRTPKLLELASNEQSGRDYKDTLTALGAMYNEYFMRDFGWRNNTKAIEKYNDWFSGVDEILDDGYGYVYMPSSVPNAYQLGGTPLDQCLGYMRLLLPKFNKQYGIEKSIMTVITDGYSHRGELFEKTQSEYDDMREQEESIGEMGWKCNRKRELIDPINRRVYTLENKSRYGDDAFSRTQNILEWISDTTGVTITGYFVCSKKHDASNLLVSAGVDNYWRVDEDWKTIRKTGLVYKVKGYNKLFVTSSNALSVAGSDELDDEFIDAKKTRILAAFKRNQKSKTTSRFLTTEFIKEIA